VPAGFLTALRDLIADPDVALDLGTANTRLYARGRGLVADEPSVLAIDEREVLPLRAGVVVDVTAAAALLRPFLRRARRGGLIRSRVLACAPAGATAEQREALREVARRAGATRVMIAPEPLAAAIGAGLDVASPYAQMLVDVGAGVTDVAVLRSGRLLLAAGLPIACGTLRNAVQTAAAERCAVDLGPAEAETLMRRAGAGDPGAAQDRGAPPTFAAVGRDRASGRRVGVALRRDALQGAMEGPVAALVGSMRRLLRELPPRVACEVIESGICLTGGGALLPGLRDRIAAGTAHEVRTAADPMHAVINGARRMLGVAARTGLWSGAPRGHASEGALDLPMQV
jgi:rod shape-determining protein MreB and related proteins